MVLYSMTLNTFICIFCIWVSKQYRNTGTNILEALLKKPDRHICKNDTKLLGKKIMFIKVAWIYFLQLNPFHFLKKPTNRSTLVYMYTKQLYAGWDIEVHRHPIQHNHGLNCPAPPLGRRSTGTNCRYVRIHQSLGL
jgi:hypothetical protein